MLVRKQWLPICYFPTTVLFLDDSRGYLNSLRLMLADDLSYRLYEAPQSALEFLQKANRQNSLTELCALSDETSPAYPMRGQPILLDLEAIYKTVYNTKRFDEISVIVADYAMPQMNGVEFFTHIQDSPAKKIMLTGQADQSIAIQAFNEGIIDKFIVKSDPDVAEALNTSITELQLRYFQQLSQGIINTLIAKTDCCLADPDFIEFFNYLCQFKNISEYYLTAMPASFLLLNNRGRAQWLVLKSEEDLRVCYELAEGTQAPPEVLQGLKEKNRIAHFWNMKQFYNVAGRAWETFMHPAKFINCGDKVYYYSLINNQFASNLVLENILSYYSYQQTTWEVA